MEGDMPEALTVVAIAVAVAGQEAKLRELQERLVADTLQEPGCVRFELNQSLDDPRMLVFTETWASEADWRKHMQGAAIQRFQASGGGRLIADFTLFRAHRVAGGPSTIKH
jgi:quinol monooxygenase YgiN